jgi:hypothetical protein
MKYGQAVSKQPERYAKLGQNIQKTGKNDTLDKK